MKSLKVLARAKINLNLYVLNKREDNYHNIKSIFHKIDLYDELTLTKSNTFKLNSNINTLNNESNIIYKAYKKLKELYPSIKGVEVSLKKTIPMQAGLGGGSTDCASFLLAMNDLYNLNLTKKELENIGSSLGADVVPCLYDVPLLAEGIGERVTPIDSNLNFYSLIIKPNMSCSTKEMYEKIDDNKEPIIDNTDIIIEGLKTNNIELISNNLYNSFEQAVDNQNLINKIKKELQDNGAIASLMTGSGSCIFGLFKTKEQATIAYDKLKEQYEIYICSSYNKKHTN